MSALRALYAIVRALAAPIVAPAGKTFFMTVARIRAVAFGDTDGSEQIRGITTERIAGRLPEQPH